MTTTAYDRSNRTPVTLHTPAGRRLTLPGYVAQEMKIGWGGHWLHMTDNHVDALVAGLAPARFLFECQEDIEEPEVLDLLCIYAEACIALAEAERGAARPPGAN